MKKFILALFLLSCPLVMFAQTPSKTEQIAELDKLIKEFKEARDRASMEAYIAGSNADRFLDQNWTDYRRAIRKQENYEWEVKELDAKIKELEAQKAALQKP